MAEQIDRRTFGLFVYAVKEMMDEDKISKEEALAALDRFMDYGEPSPEVKRAMTRLAAVDEMDFRMELGFETLRSMGKPGPFDDGDDGPW
jgi:hypothetical protein